MQDPLYQVLLKSWLQAASTILVDEDDPSKGTVRIRVGLASGPVTATVIGSRNPK
jgi:class 3 adenylate cyclase